MVMCSHTDAMIELTTILPVLYPGYTLYVLHADVHVDLKAGHPELC